MRILVPILFACVAQIAFFPAFAEEITEELLKETMQENVEAFELIEIPEDGSLLALELTLGETVAKSEGGSEFDGFRFVMPESAKGDFVWYFNAPEAWTHWYIIPAEGAPKPAFRNWLNADKLYSPTDQVGEPGRSRILQTLTEDYFEAGREYVMWFHHVKGREESDSTVRVVLGFRENADDEEWNHQRIEEALELEAAPAADQVELIGSRGGEILLDSNFFTPGYAENRIDHFFWSVRQTVRMRSGFFITMKVSVPTCATEPKLAAIEEKYGKADFVRDSSELVQKGGDPGDDEDRITYYYDYFGFVVAKGDPDRKVLQVEAQANNFASLQADGESTYGSISMENLTAFHRNGREVGRLYFFQEGDKEVVVIAEPPVGTYRRGVSEMEYFGEGRWVYQSLYEGGKLARRFPFKGHRYHGKAEGYYEDGKPQFVAHYEDGALHGELIEYTPDGEATKTMFVKGRPVEEDEGN